MSCYRGQVRQTIKTYCTTGGVEGVIQGVAGSTDEGVANRTILAIELRMPNGRDKRRGGRDEGWKGRGKGRKEWNTEGNTYEFGARH